MRFRSTRQRGRVNLPQMTYDRAYWEQLWTKTLREHPDKVAQRSPNAHLIAELAGLRPGRALDAGCGHGAETLWLAAHGWEVTAVDFSASALAHARSTAEALGPDIAARIAWDHRGESSASLGREGSRRARFELGGSSWWRRSGRARSRGRASMP
jgi:2-polyprenyl-3-methyl-5-hydroxy-6-metoxy-1,4-benzoquinol methylase